MALNSRSSTSIASASVAQLNRELILRALIKLDDAIVRHRFEIQKLERKRLLQIAAMQTLERKISEQEKLRAEFHEGENLGAAQ